MLDGERNVVVTDFGFANYTKTITDITSKSEVGHSKKESLMETSCGSPCYAAPELVISNGYVGESADICNIYI